VKPTPSCVALRADASPQAGIGHVVRCLSLAAALRDAGLQPCLVTRRLGIDVGKLAELFGIELVELPTPRTEFVPAPGEPPHARWAGVGADTDARETAAALRDRLLSWVLIDHYAFDARWHRTISQALGVKIAVIDDLADREHEADVLIDHNLAADHASKFAPTGSSIGRLLGGPRFALLNPAYRDAARYTFSERVRSVGIFVGGTDPWQASTMALDALRSLCGFCGPVEIATTSANPHLQALQSRCQADGAASLLVDQPGLQDFYARHDLQIGAGGGAAWERCCIGAPTLLLTLANNQRAVVEGLHAIGAVRAVEGADPAAIAGAFAEVQRYPEARRRMCESGRALVDGLGTRRVAVVIGAQGLYLRPATEADAGSCYNWRNAESTRRYSRDPSPVALDGHLRWWATALADPWRHLLIAQVGRNAVGVLRLDRAGVEAEVSIYIDPELTGLGLGRRMLEALELWASAGLSGIQTLTAEIDPRNGSSEAAFAASGFHRVGPRQWARRLAA
jgi:UDP-2,4-diacetamido-2,4,6-trideoxy-beta-L-altropyranose hydrolase